MGHRSKKSSGKRRSALRGSRRAQSASITNDSYEANETISSTRAHDPPHPVANPDVDGCEPAVALGPAVIGVTTEPQSRPSEDERESGEQPAEDDGDLAQDLMDDFLQEELGILVDTLEDRLRLTMILDARALHEWEEARSHGVTGLVRPMTMLDRIWAYADSVNDTSRHSVSAGGPMADRRPSTNGILWGMRAPSGGSIQAHPGGTSRA
ncbi:hypothetical protein CALVIDRAFT_562004 [Calocera viscosa TUFC12733]|uniref:Uncharacterized protein n=1 Tax=Calocera viscosa (strain TUFC12733) TaxID=1330018 RepID=A0A167P9F8_CALVF|nr:hypothetical protein CALVIDRAFT_562004 [Calocera viscosa TUFC12733]